MDRKIVQFKSGQVILISLSISLSSDVRIFKIRLFRIDPMDNQATYTLKHMYTGQRDHHKNVVIQYDADGKSCDQCMGNKKKDVLELFIRGKILTYYAVS